MNIFISAASGDTEIQRGTCPGHIHPTCGVCELIWGWCLQLSGAEVGIGALHMHITNGAILGGCERGGEVEEGKHGNVKHTTPARFERARAEPTSLAGKRLNHSAIVSWKRRW
ncbi:hypothetical protein O181_015701 [Austropuccinia psidii MF-1]|uniref:Uncharacterized protein n=1 Tax=Austropuccinia psidii MF-1 TaxID=1389203 RepID=A0A9Q3C489_9BASI|nr:hypothetical protein [Austropuccinia psidii MF-1]